ncbi:hypothetical protein AJ78_03936 [Emergomyces pasteurianus Ep9510]|uniref:Anaphase-promoting complex subunit 11 RING-H2 finger domain-containing protein n=1 Tax=Emergomyces pasteurianus Ep9510 TaxID=1447872 RepID=A0A1J9QI52_9EURO|nr:hypothetical protein AJ78_03936 [Emergomyces pasteurianus Ep9510]
MKVTLKEWNAVATWRWDMPEDEVCGICRVQFDGTCPTCKFPGDDCSLYSLPPSTSEPLGGLPPAHSEDYIPPRQPNRADDGDSNQEDLHIPPSHQPTFRPFFSLIQDAHSSEYHHPTVHYIFSDDDTDLVTEAALRALEDSQGSNSLRSSSNAHLRWREEVGADQETEALAKASSLPPPVPGVQEHYLVLDIQPSQFENTLNLPAETSNINTEGDPANSPPTPPPSITNEGPGPTPATSPPSNNTLRRPSPSHPFTITSAHSLSPSWQILNTRLCTAPTFDSSTNSPTTASASANNRTSSPVGGLMLEIEGTSGIHFNSSSIHRSPRDQHRLEEMMEQFEKRMEELRQIIAAGEVSVGGAGESRGGAEAAAEEPALEFNT